MGFYLRKSVSVGPLRFNLSKSGIGMSAGFTGLRFGTGPRGNYVHMGRHGVYYRASLPTTKAGLPQPLAAVQPFASSPVVPARIPEPPTDSLTPIESASVSEMVDASSAELLNEINSKHRRIRAAPWVFGAFLVLALVLAGQAEPDAVSPVFTVGFIAAWVVATWLAHQNDVLKKTTVLFFDVEDEQNQRYQKLVDAFAELSKCAGRWSIQAQGRTADWKHQAGASHLVRRKAVTVQTDPPVVKTNVAVPTLPLKNETLCFFPDRVLVFSRSEVGAVSYDSLRVEHRATRFIESESVPRDAQTVGQTWQYPNKGGGPDKRFKNNRQLPVVIYEELAVTSESGLNALLQVSRIGTCEPLCLALDAMRELNAEKTPSVRASIAP